MRNLEIKAVADDLGAARTRLRGLTGARLHARLRQTDWYFRVPTGRLKLRVVGGQRDGELVAYLRPTRTAARTSEFQRLPTADAAGTKRLLDRMLGPRACVRKRREVWLYQNARIHLDSVEGLGPFLEIEVVMTRGVPQARMLMKALMEVLGIRRKDLIAGSYGELGGKRRAPRPSPLARRSY